MNLLLADPITVDRATVLISHPDELGDDVSHRDGQTAGAKVFHHSRNAI
jgi:hypothetical protein